MKQLLMAACAATLLSGTALAQAPAAKDKAGPAAQPESSAQPSQSSGSRPGAQAPADKSAAPAGKMGTSADKAGASADKGAAPADKAAGPAGAKPGGSTAQKPADDKQAPSGVIAAKPQGSVQVTFYAVKPADVQASTLIGSTVYNVNNESIGDIEDLVLEDGKTLRAVVIGVGGFLGMGEHDVAVEPGALIIRRNTDNDDVQIVLNTTKDDLKNAPAVKFDKDSRQQAASKGSSEMAKPAGTTGAGDAAKDRDDAAAKPGDAGKAGGMKKSDGMGESKAGTKKAN